MSVYELVSIFTIAGQKLDSLWEFFVTVHLAIYGALFLFHKMKTHQAIVAVVSYFAFSIINLRAKYNEYLFYESVLDDIKSRDLSSISNINVFMADYHVDDRISIAITVHVISAVFFIYLLSNSRFVR